MLKNEHQTLMVSFFKIADCYFPIATNKYLVLNMHHFVACIYICFLQLFYRLVHCNHMLRNLKFLRTSLSVHLCLCRQRYLLIASGSGQFKLSLHRSKLFWPVPEIIFADILWYQFRPKMNKPKPIDLITFLVNNSSAKAVVGLARAFQRKKDNHFVKQVLLTPNAF